MAGPSSAVADPAFIELAEAYAKRELVLFVGAGVSAAAGLPSWGRLVDQLAERAEQRGAAPAVLDEIAQLAGRGQLIDALSALRAALGPQEFCVAIERLLDDRTREVPDAGHAIADLAPGLRALLTTNIDRLLERALGGQWPEVARATGDLAQRERVIIKLHGTLYDRSTWVFTRDDYDRAMYADPKLAGVFSAIFHARTLLFVGYGLADDDFDQVLSKVRAVSGDQAPRHFALVPASTVTPFRKQKLEAAGLRLIAYENADGKHGEVASFLRALAGTSAAAASPPAAAPSTASAGGPAPAAGKRKRVLVVAANPRGTDALKLDTEIRALKESIKLGKHRDAIEVEVLHATTVDDLRRALLDKPRDIVHFCGHATKDGLQLEDEGGRIVVPDTEALAELMKRRGVETVLLNACYSLDAIKSSPVGTAWTVAMDGLVSDAGAIELSRGFYDVIGGGGGVEEAFAEGMSCAKLKRRAVHAVLIGKGTGGPSGGGGGGGGPTKILREDAVEAPPRESPFPGLSFFEEARARYCFGRETELTEATRHPDPPATMAALAVETDGQATGYLPLRRDAFAALRVPTLPERCDCFGRAEEVRDIVQALLRDEPRPVLLLGGPGIGKSTISVEALYHPAVGARFGARRYFVRLDAAPTAGALVGAVAVTMGLPPGTVQRTAVYDALSFRRAVLVLDNAEMPWDRQDGERERTETVFGELCALPGVAVVVSLRSTTAPKGAPWGLRIDVDPLQEEAQIDLFCSIAGERHRADPDLRPLLQHQGGVPFAIDLLARAGDGGSVALLAEEWKLRRTYLLTRQGSRETRHTSWAASIEVSFQSDRMTPEARRLARLLSLLPDGVASENLAFLTEGNDGGFVAARALRQVGLVFNESGRLRMRAPIREYLAQEHSPNPAMLARAISWYAEFAKNLGKRVGYRDGIEVVARLAAETANLDAMLRQGMNSVAAAAHCARAAVALTDFARFSGRTSPSPLRPALDVARAIGDHHLEACCLRSLGEVTTWHSGEEARAYLESALKLFAKTDDVRSRADCVHRIGHVALDQSRHDEAARHFKDALLMYQQVGDVLGIAYCNEDFGDIARQRTNYAIAKEHYEVALDLYSRLDFVGGEAGCRWSLGEVSLREDDLVAARHNFQSALELYRLSGNVKGESDSILGLGWVAQGNGRDLEAREQYETALLLAHQVGFVRGQADCVQSLGDLAAGVGDIEQARLHYARALDLYARVPVYFSMGHTRRCLMKIAVDATERRSHMEAARAAWEQVGRQDLIDELLAEFDHMSDA